MCANTWMEWLKIVGTLTIPVTLYLAWMKLGYRVGATYTWGFSSLSAQGISAITLMNLKDRPVAIFEAHAVMDDKSLSLKKFDPPFILKGLEAASIPIEPASSYSLENEIFEWKAPILENGACIDIYLATSGKNIKCLKRGPSTHFKTITKKNLKIISKHTRRYNDHIINDDAQYAVIYNEDGKTKTVFIDKHGHMHNWDYLPNALHPNDLKNGITVRNAIENSNIGFLMKNFAVEDLKKK